MTPDELKVLIQTKYGGRRRRPGPPLRHMALPHDRPPADSPLPARSADEKTSKTVPTCATVYDGERSASVVPLRPDLTPEELKELIQKSYGGHRARPGRPIRPWRVARQRGTAPFVAVPAVSPQTSSEPVVHPDGQRDKPLPSE